MFREPEIINTYMYVHMYVCTCVHILSLFFSRLRFQGSHSSHLRLFQVELKHASPAQNKKKTSKFIYLSDFVRSAEGSSVSFLSRPPYWSLRVCVRPCVSN